MTQLIFDYASVDGNSRPGAAGFQKMKAVGCRMVGLRGIFGRPSGGQSPVYKDPVWLRDKDDAVAAGLARMSYLFLCVPRKDRPFTPDPEVQVDALADYVQVDKPELGKKPHDMVASIDVEEHSDILGPDEYYDWVLRAAKRYRARYGVWPSLYTAMHIWQEYLNNHLPGQLAACPLWIAKPWPWPENTAVHLDGAAGFNPKTIPVFGDSTNWALYQYQGDALNIPGISHTADASRANYAQRGSKGTWVMWIQARAGGLTIDGDFGPATEAKIKELQAQYALTADGKVGLDTVVLLSWLNPAPL